MAKRIRELCSQPPYILSSDSQRARETAAFVRDEFNLSHSSIRYDKRLYLAGIPELLRVLKEVDSHKDRVLMIAHNPGITDFHNWLSPEALIESFPTFGVSEFELNLDAWDSFPHPPETKRTHFIYPKMFD